MIQGQDYSYIQKYRQRRLNYPIRFTYINKISTWWPPKQTLLQMALPSQQVNVNISRNNNKNYYNYVALTFWTCLQGPTDISKVWDDPISYFGKQFGQSRRQSQKNLKRKYNQKGISIILSVFGATQKPTSLNQNPINCANKLATYVKQNYYDGVDVDYEDNQAMNSGTGEQWLRKLLPYHIISHAPQAPYFMDQYYRNGGYRKIHQQVGSLIDFYNVQYYNQGKSQYKTYEQLFIKADINSPMTSVLELVQDVRVPINMIVIGKPGAEKDVDNTGYANMTKLIQFTIKGNRQIDWKTGFMVWQFSSDNNYTLINKLSSILYSFYRK